MKRKSPRTSAEILEEKIIRIEKRIVGDQEKLEKERRLYTHKFTLPALRVKYEGKHFTSKSNIRTVCEVLRVTGVNEANVHLASIDTRTGNIAICIREIRLDLLGYKCSKTTFIKFMTKCKRELSEKVGWSNYWHHQKKKKRREED
jgi:hypothetical protein